MAAGSAHAEGCCAGEALTVSMHSCDGGTRQQGGTAQSILDLYGVHSSSSTCSVAKHVMDLSDEEALALDGQRSTSPEGHAQDMPLVDLPMSPTTPALGHHG